MFQSDIRIALCHFLYNPSPQSGRIQYVSLIHAGNFLFPLSGNIKTFDSNSTDLVLIVGQGINSFSHTVLFDRLTLTEVKSAGQLSHDQHVKSGFADLLFQRARCCQFIVKYCGS